MPLVVASTGCHCSTNIRHCGCAGVFDCADIMPGLILVKVSIEVIDDRFLT
jgi:hypothetical protein